MDNAWIQRYGTTTDRVVRGVAEVWSRGYSLREIDLSTFDINSPIACVLGQLTGEGYWVAVGRWALSSDDARSMGFMPLPVDGDPDALNEEWRRVIAATQHDDD